MGEPVKLVVRWKAEQDLQRVFVERGLFQERSLSFVVSEGGQLKTYREIPHDTADGVVRHGGMTRGTVTVTNLILVQGRYEEESLRGWGGFLFRAPGKYSVSVVYTDPATGGSATSNALRFTVSEPTGEDREILEAAKTRPMMLALLGDRESRAKAEELMHRHSRSPYLRYTRLRALWARLWYPHKDLAPETLDRFRRYDRDAHERYLREHFHKIGDEVSAETEWGAFEEEALALAIAAAQQELDKDKANHARDELFRKFPDSATAGEMRERGANSKGE